MRARIATAVEEACSLHEARDAALEKLRKQHAEDEKERVLAMMHDMFAEREAAEASGSELQKDRTSTWTFDVDCQIDCACCTNKECGRR